MKRLLIFCLITLTLQSCSTKNYDKNVIPTSSISNSDITSSNNLSQGTPLNIALLVPTDAARDNKGSSLVQAVQLAVSEAENNNIQLTILDSNLLTTNEDSVTSSLNDQQIIIGPLYASDTLKIAPSINNVTILSLSNDSSIKANNILIMGISPSSQAITVVEYAIGQGVNKFHLLLPENKFGHLINSAVESTLSEKNGMSYTATWYEPNNSEDSINQLVSSLDHNSANEAILMPQGDKKSLQALNKSLDNKKSKIKLIGLQGWDNSEILSLNNLNGAVFIRKNMPEGIFHDKYKAIFGSTANNLEYITYNCVILAINMHNAGLALTKSSIIENNKVSGKYSDVQFNSMGDSFYNLPLTKIHENDFSNLE